MVLMCAGSAIAGGIEISDASIRATAPGMTATGGYLTIANHGDSDDRLISASAEFAGRVELHEMIMDGDVMKMREREDGIAAGWRHGDAEAGRPSSDADGVDGNHDAGRDARSHADLPVRPKCQDSGYGHEAWRDRWAWTETRPQFGRPQLDARK